MSESEIMYDDSEMTPQEQEKAVRDRVTELKDEIMETVAHLSYLHHEYDNLLDIIAEIDIYGADDLFAPRPAKYEYVARSNGGNYVF